MNILETGSSTWEKMKHGKKKEPFGCKIDLYFMNYKICKLLEW